MVVLDDVMLLHVVQNHVHVGPYVHVYNSCFTFTLMLVVIVFRLAREQR